MTNRLRVIRPDPVLPETLVPVKPADQSKPDAAPPRSSRLQDVLANYPAVREEHLRSLRRLGLIGRPADADGERRVAFPDLAVIRQLHKALQEGAPFKAILRAMLASREGQLTFDFRLDAQPAKVITLRSPAQPALPASPAPSRADDARAIDARAEEHFVVASALDDGSEANRSRALAAYRQALEFDPDLVPALINLANLHYAQDHLIEALALYERAVGLEPEVFEGHFNLGNIHQDLGRYAEAEMHYRRALALNAAYPEAHLYLAVALEKAGRSDAARTHWKAYRSLAPDGEWADLAREFSE
jgi:tetratricopeptide (TPR) repeat protein